MPVTKGFIHSYHLIGAMILTGDTKGSYLVFPQSISQVQFNLSVHQGYLVQQWLLVKNKNLANAAHLDDQNNG